MIIVAAIAFGLWGGLFSSALMTGMIDSSVETAVNRDLAHIQIHYPDFSKDKDIKKYIPEGAKLITDLDSIKEIKALSARTILQGMAQSPSSAYGVNIYAIEPRQARQVTDLHSKIIEGAYFESKRRNPVIIGKKLAERLNLKLHKKIVFSFENPNGDITFMACRISGIFKSASAQFDGFNVFMRHQDLFRILEYEPFFHEIAIRVQTVQSIQAAMNKLQKRYPHLQIQDWEHIAPELAFLSESMNLYSYIFITIILLALLFGITNTMLMSVVERIREFGMLMAVGMKKLRVFFMLILETILLSFTGGLIGILISVLSIAVFGNSGIDFSFYEASLESFGASSIIYPFLPLEMYFVLSIMIFITANLAAFYPAWKATHLSPSRAIRNY